jgi:hypothetical protein
MFSKTFLIAMLLGAAVDAGRPALAEEAVSTAAAAPATADQIDQWIKSAPPPNLADDQPDGVTPGAAPASPARKIHGEVGVSVGTGGYRSGYAISTMPIGDTGSMTLAVGQSRGPRAARFGGGDWSSASLGASFGGAAYGEGAGPACRASTGWTDQDLPADPGVGGRSRLCGLHP